MKPNTLAIAVASGRIGYVYLTDGELRDWGISVVASRSPDAAKEKAEQLFRIYQPQLIVTEELTLHTRKSGRTIQNIQIIAEAAQKADAHHITVERVQHYANKYIEMKELAKKYSVLENWMPSKRKLWESEDRRATIWEALALQTHAKVNQKMV